jgi:hypothetical protein
MILKLKNPRDNLMNLWSMPDAEFIVHKSEESPYYEHDTWKYYQEPIYDPKCSCIIIDHKDEDQNKIIITRPTHWSAHPLILNKAINVIQKDDITTICEKLGAIHYVLIEQDPFEKKQQYDYILDFEKGNIFCEENKHGKIIFFNKNYYKFIPHKKHNYNPKTGMISVDYFEFINKGIPHEQDAFVKTFFTFKQENVYANIFEEMAIFDKSTKNKFKTDNLNSLISIII